MRSLIQSLPLLALAAAPAAAQQFTTAAEVRPILDATRANWIGIREYDGRDLIYFTHLLAWRCGLTAVRFSVNGDPTVYAWPMEPCYEGTAAPNAILSPQVLPYVEMPLGTAQSVSVTLELDDGSVMTGDYARAAVRIP
jgi:hypothetical protein